MTASMQRRFRRPHHIDSGGHARLEDGVWHGARRHDDRATQILPTVRRLPVEYEPEISVLQRFDAIETVRVEVGHHKHFPVGFVLALRDRLQAIEPASANHVLLVHRGDRRGGLTARCASCAKAVRQLRDRAPTRDRRPGMVGHGIWCCVAVARRSSSLRSSPLSTSVAGSENGDVGFAALQKSFARGSKIRAGGPAHV